MLIHDFETGQNPSRVVVLGASGFIGGAIHRTLIKAGYPTLPISRAEVELQHAHASDKLAGLLENNDTLVFVAAKAPCRDLPMLVENIQLLRTVCNSIKMKPVAHVVYISSDAVYKDSPNALTEISCAEPGSIHGAMHLAREVALKQEFCGPLAIVRPTLVYGLDDPHNSYGPNRFRRLASAGKDIVLFGEGEERRDHVDVDDVAHLVHLIVKHRSRGVVNAVSGEVVSFRDLAVFASKSFESNVKVRDSMRTGLMPHNGYRHFDNSMVATAFPNFRFKGWREGLSALYLRPRVEGQV